MENGSIRRLVTLNIAHGRGLSLYQGFHGERGIARNLGRIGRLLRRVDADIVALQEVDEDSHWNRRINLLETLREDTGYPYAYLGVNNRREGRLPLAYGNGILARHEIVHRESRSFGVAELGEKGFLYTEIELPDGHLPLVNLHLDFRSRARRIEQIEQLIDYLERRHRDRAGQRYFEPVVCGDFNCRRAKPADAVNHLFTYLQDSFRYRMYPDGARTFPSLLPSHGLDFIMMPEPFRVSRCRVLRSYVSDHRPVVIDFAVRE